MTLFSAYSSNSQYHSSLDGQLFDEMSSLALKLMIQFLIEFLQLKMKDQSQCEI